MSSEKIRKPELGPIITPSEHGALPIRINRNCHWNKCLFCPVYKGKKFSQRSVEEIKQDIDLWIKKRGNYFRDFFLQDSDPLATNHKDLLEILGYLKERMPWMERITCYARAGTIAQKTLHELTEYHKAGLSEVYIGLESGYDRLLSYMKKGLSQKTAIKAGLKIKEAGIKVDFFILLGMAGRLCFDGKEAWKSHALETAKVLNAVNPDYIRFRTLYVSDKKPYKSPLADYVKQGKFQEASGQEVLKEQILLIENLDVTSRIECRFVSNYFNLPCDYIFPRDKETMIRQIKKAIEIPGFIEEKTKYRRL